MRRSLSILVFVLFATVTTTAVLSATASGLNHETGTIITLVKFNATTPNSHRLAAHAAAGFLNRAVSPVVYVESQQQDSMWKQLLLSDQVFQQQSVDDFIVGYLQGLHAVDRKVILYSSNTTELNEVMSTVVTYAAVLDALPVDKPLLEKLSASVDGISIAMDTRGKWGSSEAAVRAAMEDVLHNTSSLCMISSGDVTHGELVDWIISKKLFTQYMSNCCEKTSPHNPLFKELVSRAPWPKPVRVYGYNGQDQFLGGDMYEAETDCINTMGQIASWGCTNLAFWSKFEPFNVSAPRGSTYGPLIQPPPKPVSYDPSKAYVALVYGDLDNIMFVESFAQRHMQYRATHCNASSSNTSSKKSKCFPFTWTLSPNLIEMAPALMRWYFDQASATGGQDSFIMPPSGTLYSYPGMMPSAVQEDYVEQQSAQAAIMNTSGSIHWEWFYDWNKDWATYFPRYVNRTGPTTKSFFLDEVPWPLPIPGMMGPNHSYRWFGTVDDPDRSVVVFRPSFNWEPQGSGGVALTPQQCAEDVVNKFLPGSVQYIYTIQNTRIEDIFEMVSLVDDSRVEFVGYQELVELARQKELFEHGRP